MTEKQMQELMQNLDNDLLTEELDELMSGMDIDLDSITKKAFTKLNKEQSKMKLKRKRIYPIAAACLIIAIGASTAYAGEISDFVKSFFNQKVVYSTVADGSAYYLKSPVQLAEGSKLENVIFTKDKLEMNLTYPLKEDKLPEISVTTQSGKLYKPGGYSTDNGQLSISFWNEAEQNYVFTPSQELKLMIGGKNYTIHLTGGTSVVGSGEIIPAEKSNIDWVKVGYQKTAKGVQILTSFNDQDLKLESIGEPAQKTATDTFKNENGTTCGGTSSMTNPLLGYDKHNHVYTFTEAKNAVGRPVTQFESQAPAGQEIDLKIPSLLVGYEKTLGHLEVPIPSLNEEKQIGQVIDLKLQKITLKSIKRTSATTAELKFALNTGNNPGVTVRDANLYSNDVQSGNSIWQGDECTMRINFNEKLKKAKFDVDWPTFVVNGNWTLKIK
ncbi:hypothetical protein DEAC_c32050 [Desulfosporosinus acididurans]|uniref:DUF4179 domain-containing protein n=1 Tax=Desulfosporosinus acididurans TaxID=476652 RepID=A0A0J1FNE9_9FIRM|nr:hypothetical protein [Desulfosporosinus acididurans]KLU64877.1 hypothetical protein DEAC_c32050 [Desulfosporosinus acididurans]